MYVVSLISVLITIKKPYIYKHRMEYVYIFALIMDWPLLMEVKPVKPVISMANQIY